MEGSGLKDHFFLLHFSYGPTGCTQQVGLRADFSPPTPPKRNIPTWWCFESQAAPGLYYKELPKQCISFCRFSQCVESWANFVPNTSLMAAPYVATCFSWEYWDTSNQGVDPVYKVIRLFNWVGYLTLHPHFKIQNISRCIRIPSEKQTMSMEPLKLREYTSLTLNSGAPPRGARTSALN